MRTRGLTQRAPLDLRSDTVSLPPPGMRAAMARARVGDDVYGEDPTVNALERRAAESVGKAAALFVPSGTMANLLALLAHAGRGAKVLVGDASDVWRWEAGGAAVLGGLVYEPVPTRAGGELDLDALERACDQRDDPQCAVPALVCLENTHCLSGGRVLSDAHVAAVRALARRHDLKLHLDGARLWNAAVARGLPAQTLCRPFDSVCFSLSKGLCAPAGSLLCGDGEFVRRARRLRKMLGGGMRQAGFLAAAGLFGLERLVPRLARDHAHARLLWDGLGGLSGLRRDPEPPQTNIVFFELREPTLAVAIFLEELRREGVRLGELGRGRIRAVTHRGITRADIGCVLDALPRALSRAARRSRRAA